MENYQKNLSLYFCVGEYGRCKKWKLLVISKSINTCFKISEKLSVKYHTNKAWICWNSLKMKFRLGLMTKRRRRDLPYSCTTAQYSLTLKSNINIFSSNLTSILQLIDQGVIRSLKVYYRQMSLSILQE